MGKRANGLTWRQERFCRAIAEGHNATRAAVEARYAVQWAPKHGSRLMGQPRIRARVAAIQAEMAREACADTAPMLGKLEMIYRRALEDRCYSAAARAVAIQARLTAQAAGAAFAAGEAAAEAAEAQAVDSPGESGKM